MSISEIYSTKRIFEIEIEPFTDEELELSCSGNRVNSRFVRPVEGKKSIRGTLILARFPLYVELLKDAHPDFPIRWADHISPAYDSKSKLQESTLYTYQPFLFRVQERLTQTFAPDHKRDCAMIETLVRIEVTRKEDSVIVLGGLFTLAERQDAEVLEITRMQNFASSLQTA